MYQLICRFSAGLYPTRRRRQVRHDGEGSSSIEGSCLYFIALWTECHVWFMERHAPQDCALHGKGRDNPWLERWNCYWELFMAILCWLGFSSIVYEKFMIVMWSVFSYFLRWRSTGCVRPWTGRDKVVCQPVEKSTHDCHLLFRQERLAHGLYCRSQEWCGTVVITRRRRNRSTDSSLSLPGS